MTWQPGASVVREMLANGEVERVQASLELADALHIQAEQSLAVAEYAFSIGALHNAYGDLWEGVRKALTALLQAQGLRPKVTAKGGHHRVVQELIKAQFGGAFGAIIAPVPRLRTRRNNLEYPDEDTFVESDEVRESLDQAREIISAAGTILQQDVLTVFVS